MASTELQTGTLATTITHGRNLVRAGARVYAFINDGTNLVYQYSDDDEVTWSSETTIAAGARLPSAEYNATLGRMYISYAGENSAGTALRFRAITSNVATGVPGALTPEVSIDAGGSNAGVQYPYLVVSDTATNPRIWIIAKKWTAAGVSETRVWHCLTSVDPATMVAGDWSTTNFTNLGGNSDANENKMGMGFWWTVGGANKVTFVFGDGSAPMFYEAVTFDPTAATPTPGTVTSDLFAHSGPALIDPNINGVLIAGNAKADYLMFGRYDSNAGTWGFWKTTNGTSWSQPNSGWIGVAGIGRCQVAKSGSDFYLLHGSSYGAIASSAQPLKYRLLTTSSDTMGGVQDFSDSNGNGVAVPLDTGTSKLYGLYRGSTASPYTIRGDTANIGGAADTTAPGQATVSAACVGDTQIDVTITMPADVDVAEYEVRFLTGTTYPSINRSNGTAVVPPTATSANAVVTLNHTGLTSGTRYAYRVFVKDTAGNWNTGALATAVAATLPTFLQRYTAGGTPVPDATTPGGNGVVLEYQLHPTDFETAGGNAHFQFRVGYNEATPPDLDAFDYSSGITGQTIFRYEDPPASGTFLNVPVGGLTSTYWGRKLRIHTDTVQSSQYGSPKVKQ